MTDTVTAKLAEWEALSEAATEGPWTFEPGGDYECGDRCCSDYWHNRIWKQGQILAESHMLSDEDAEFIAVARTTMPALLAAVKGALKVCDERRAVCGDDYTDGWRDGWADALLEVRRAITQQIGGER